MIVLKGCPGSGSKEWNIDCLIGQRSELHRVQRKMCKRLLLCVQVGSSIQHDARVCVCVCVCVLISSPRLSTLHRM